MEETCHAVEENRPVKRRHRQPLHITLSPSVMKMLEEYREKYDPESSYSRLIERLLREILIRSKRGQVAALSMGGPWPKR